MRTRFLIGMAAASLIAASPLGLVGGFASLESGCASAKTVGAGSECFQATDCNEGLVCVPVKVGSDSRVCSNDLTNLVSTEDAAADGAGGGKGGGGSGGDASGDGARPPAKDAGQDAAQPPVDSGGD